MLKSISPNFIRFVYVIFFILNAVSTHATSTSTIKVGEKVTFHSVSVSNITRVEWVWDYNILECQTSIFTTTTRVTFKGRKASPPSGTVVQAITYYKDSWSNVTKKHVQDWYVIVEEDQIYVQRITLDPSSVEMNVGNTQLIRPTIQPENATNQDVVWSSNNSTVASVSNTGWVQANSIGTAIITCYSTDGSGVYSQCTVKVSPLIIYVTSVSLNATSATLNVGDTKQLYASVSPSSATDKSVSWSSSNSSVASVSSNGLVTANSSGSATITCKANDGSGKTATCSITVKESTVYVTGISLNISSASLNVGDTKQLTATITPYNATDKSVSWSSSNYSVASVSSNGLVTAVSSGSATITCKANDGSGKTASCSITVKESTVYVTGISLNSSSASLTVGSTKQLTATITPYNASDKSVSWSSSNSSVASVTSNGLVTANSSGSATITCRANDGSGKTATCSITVKESTVYVTGISLNSLSASLTVGSTKQLTATITPYDATDKSVSWSSGNYSVASVTSNGLVSGRGVGQTYITATTSNGLQAKCLVNVQESHYSLFVWTKDGSKSAYPFTDNPQISIVGDVFTVSSIRMNMEYAAADVLRFTLEDGGSAVNAINPPYFVEPQMDIQKERVCMSQCEPNSLVCVYCMSGQIVQAVRADTEGFVSLELAGYSPGIYIVKTETMSFKIIKK